MFFLFKLNDLPCNSTRKIKVYVFQIIFFPDIGCYNFPKFCQIGLARDSIHHDIQVERFEADSSSTDKVKDSHTLYSAIQQIMNNSYRL